MIEKIELRDKAILDIYVQMMGPIVRKIVDSIKVAKREGRDKDVFILMKQFKQHRELCHAYGIGIHLFLDEPDE